MAYHTHVPIELTCFPSLDSDILLYTPDKKSIILLPFTKADGKSYIRFSVSKSGEYVYKDAIGKKRFYVNEYKGENNLFYHGGVEVKKNAVYLSHSDGKPFFWLADTWWYGATRRMQWPKPFQQIVGDRKKKGFTVVQIVVGIPPEIDPFTKESENNGGSPFYKDWAINVAYFDEVDKKVAYLVEQGIVPCIVGGWGHHIEWMGIEKMQHFWRELVARYAAYPVVFCLAGEIDIHIGTSLLENVGMISVNTHTKKSLAVLSPRLFAFMKKLKQSIFTHIGGMQKKALLEKRMKKWRSIGAYIAQIDSYNRPITAHVSALTNAKHMLGSPSWLSIDSIQSGHDLDRISFMVHAIRKNNNHCIINMEPWYEGILGNFGAYHQRLAFWVCLLSGAKGHSYGAHGLWQMAEKEDGFMSHWGKSDWKDTLAFSGAKQLGIGKEILSNYAWWKIKSDSSLVTPCWSKKNIYGAVSARIGIDVIFVYTPKPSPLLLTLPSNGSYTVQIINPGNGKLLQTLAGKNTINLPFIPGNEDLFYLAKKTNNLI